MGHSLDALMVVKFSPRLHHCGISGAHSELLSEIRLLHWYFRATKERMSSTCGHCGEKAIETTSYGRTHFQNCGKTIGQNKNKNKKIPGGFDSCVGETGGKRDKERSTYSEEWASLWYVISPVACGRNEVNAAVDSGVWDPLLPVYVDLLLQVGFVLVIDELHDGLPADGGQQMRGGGVISLWSTGTVVSTGTTGG